jgi:hypothetical protein
MAFDLCPPALIDKVLAETFDPPLADLAFQKIRHRFYVRSRLPEVNEVIEFHRDRLDLNFTWGLSLNFVPHITEGVENVRWHRTQKSARRDLYQSGFGKSPQLGWSVGTIQGEAFLRRSAELTRTEMLPKALAFFDSIRSLRDLLPKFREAAQPNDWGWTLEMRPQLHLAYTFYLAKQGQAQEAEKMMSDWLARNFDFLSPETLERISDLFRQAIDSPFVLQ